MPESYFGILERNIEKYESRNTQTHQGNLPQNGDLPGKSVEIDLQCFKNRKRKAAQSPGTDLQGIKKTGDLGMP